MQATTTFEGVRFGGNVITRIALLGAPDSVGLNVVDFVQPRSARYAADALRRALVGDLRGRPVQLVTPEDFVLIKVLSTRDRDLEDALSVLRSLGEDLDMDLIRTEGALLSREIADHDVAGRLARITTGDAR